MRIAFSALFMLVSFFGFSQEPVKEKPKKSPSSLKSKRRKNAPKKHRSLPTGLLPLNATPLMSTRRSPLKKNTITTISEKTISAYCHLSMKGKLIIPFSTVSTNLRLTPNLGTKPNILIISKQMISSIIRWQRRLPNCISKPSWSKAKVSTL